MSNITFDVSPALLEAFRNIVRQELDRKTIQLKKSPKTLTRTEASELLKCSLPTLDKLISKGEIPAIKKGRRVFISETALDQFISSSSPVQTY